MKLYSIARKIIIALSTICVAANVSAFEFRVLMRAGESGPVITDIVPAAFTENHDFIANGVYQPQDSTYRFTDIQDEKILIIYKIGENFHGQSLDLPQELYELCIPENLLQELAVPEHLGELTVEGRNQYTDANKTTYIPTKKEKRISSGGIELLQRMGISSLYVDPMSKTVTTAAGDGIELFIDMQPASTQEVSMLRAVDIQTVEFLESPSDPRFRGARYVLNYVLVKYEYGGYTVADAHQRVIAQRGDYSVYSRYTKGRMLYDAAGGFGYISDSHSGQDNTSVYVFPEMTLEKRSLDDGAHSSSRNGYGTFKAVWQSPSASIANTASISGRNTPHDILRSSVSYRPGIFPDETSEKQSHSSNLSAVWSGNYYFTLPWELSLSVMPTASYSKYRSSYSYIESSTITNDSHDKTWSYNVLASLEKKIGKQSIGLRLGNNGSGNSVTYYGTVPSDAHGSMYGGLADISANVRFGKFWGQANAGIKLSYQTVSGEKDNDISPAYFITAGYSFSPYSQMSVYSNYTPYTVPMSMKSDNMVLTDNLSALRGNPHLKQGAFFNLGVRYNFNPTRKFGVAAYWTFTRYSNMIVSNYNPGEYIGRQVMIHSYENNGFLNNHSYGVNLSVKCLNNNLQLYGGVRGLTVAYRSLTSAHGTRLSYYGQILYLFGAFYASASYNSHVKSIGYATRNETPGFYQVTVGWGNGDWNISAMASNPSVSSYKNGYYSIDTPYYSIHNQSYGSPYHRFFSFNVRYSFSYGKKIQRDGNPGKLQGNGSGILEF